MWKNQLFTSLLFFGLLVIMFGCQLGEDEIEPLPGMEVPTSTIFINHLETSGEFEIKNTGNVPIEWSVSSTADYYLISPFNGLLAPGETINPKITVYKDELKEGVFRSSIFLSTDKEIFNQLNVVIVSYTEEKWLLDVGIVDAEYNTPMDKIVAVSSNNSMLIIDPANKSLKSIQLGMPAIALALHPNGKHAVVGHIAALSLVDLEKEKVIKQIGLPFEMFDLVVGPNNYVYINPAGYEQGTLYNLNLDDNQGQWSYNFPIYSRTRLSLHPSGKFIFAANTTITPSDVYKIDISDGIAKFISDSPYHGNYDFGGGIWISESGNQFFAKRGYVFRISEDESFDLTYLGKLSSGNYFSAINYSSKIHRIYGIHNQFDQTGHEGGAQDMLARFNSNFQLIEETPLPNFLDNDANGNFQILKSRARFGFFNAQSTAYFILSHSTNPIHTGPDKWALTRIAVKSN